MQQQAEEITTIFVVGFPEDMQEREFQNMFTFAGGFEAAILKIPTAAEESADSYAYGRKQIIGFARFRTRQDALEAKNIITGKKIDMERNCILKAEFAKKNLHQKRSQDPQQQQQQQMLQGKNMIMTHQNMSSISLDAADLKQRDFLPSRPTSTVPFGKRAMTPFETSLLPLETPTSGPGSINILSSKDESLYIHSPPPIPADILDSPAYDLDMYPNDPTGEQTAHSLFHGNNSGSGAIPRATSHHSFHDFMEKVPELANPSTTTNSLNHSRSTSITNGILDHRSYESHEIPFLNRHAMDSFDILQNSDIFPTLDSSRTGTPLSLLNVLNQGMGNMSLVGANGSQSSAMPLNPQQSHQQQQTHHYSPGLDSAGVPLSNGFRGSSDQNPPCNTLYVGNLPPNTSPEELENLFSKCRGYKRLCFRNRPAGPMCFVEFEDIQHATMVMYELYGYPLSTHTKGGIRLSFSKNPLGVRLPQHHQEHEK